MRVKQLFPNLIHFTFFCTFEQINKLRFMVKKKLEINYQEFEFNQLSNANQELIKTAVDSAGRAYAPYSEFFVGAAVRLEDGTVLKGNNQENAAYPSGLCAERVVLFYANANFPDTAVETMAIVVIDKKGNIIDKNISPCGSCRQVIAETETRYKKPVRIMLASANSVLVFNSIRDLLPFSFNQGDLKRKK
jgi:cytidine deaminase